MDSGLAWECSKFFKKSSPGFDHLLRSVKSVEMLELHIESTSVIHVFVFMYFYYYCLVVLKK